MSTNLGVDLVKTIDEEEDVPDYSEESEPEVEFQPTKQKQKDNLEFEKGFKFVGSTAEYNYDYWNDIAKYVKRKVKRKTDEKIEKVKFKKKESKEIELPEKNDDVKEEPEEDDPEEDEEEDEFDLSDTDLQRDTIKTKQKKSKKEKENVEFSEEITTTDSTASFYQMNLSRPLLKAISAMKFTYPTPIQAATIPMALLGRDICGCAATGTGKTAAYMLPTLERLLYKPQGGSAITRVLVLVPTRELGVQVYQVSKQLAQFTMIEFGLSVGGLDLKVQKAFLRKQPDVVIATPGRLIDHMKNTPGFSLDAIEILVLDEADRMLDEYFAEQMKEIVKQCAKSRQTLLFSATMTTAVEDLASVSLDKPVKIFVDSNSNVAFNLRQEFIRIRSDKEGDREAILAALVCRTFRDHCMVFVQTKKQAHRLHILLGLLNLKVGELHGNLTQPQRLDALKRFKEGEVDVLVATDVAARGLDIVGVKTVINFTLPATLQHYIHRVGRTARAGRVGVSVSLAGEGERRIVKEIIKNARQPVKSRVIPPDILERYKSKVEEVEADIEQILREEHEERQIEKAEKQMNRLENQLNENGAENSTWFQTKQERKQEKERLRLENTPEITTKGKKRKNDEGPVKENPKKKTKKKKRKVPEDTPENRVRKEMMKVALLQARLAKSKSKQKKIRAVADPNFNFSRSAAKHKFEGPAKKKKYSNFTEDLTDISRKGVKRLRYESNKKRRTDFFSKKKQNTGGAKMTGPGKKPMAAGKKGKKRK